MLKELEDYLKKLNKVAIAYSGGIDSSFLLYVANKVLPRENVLAIIANGCMVQRKDYNEAILFLKENNFNYKEIPYNPLEIEEFKQNQKQRCYFCKKTLMGKIKKEAIENGFKYILDGKNIDDTKVYRPGNKATEELEIISPLEKVGFTKKDIRVNAKELGIKFWNKPSNSCLATRFPYNTVLSQEDLIRVDKGEEILKALGIQKVRLRVHKDIVRIEVNKEDFNTIIKHKEIVEEIRKLGFKYVTLDLDGIKSGVFDKDGLKNK